MFKQFQVALLGAAALIAGPASAGTITWGTFGGVKAEYKNVTESGDDVVPPATGVFVPQTPSYTENPNPQLTFLPQNFVKTDVNQGIDLKSKSALLSFAVASKPLIGNPDYVGYVLTGNTINVAGTYSLWAPFGDVGEPVSIAKVAMSANYTIQVTGVNWLPYSGGSAINRSMTIVPSGQTVTGPQNDTTTGNWAGTSTIDWNDVRIAAGVGTGDFITELSIQLTAQIAAASIYGIAETRLTNLNLTNPVDPIAVPEPPTVILAGLGVAAAVGQGYRRRKQRQAGSEPMANCDDNGAIALTA
jgi:hypothetical protein